MEACETDSNRSLLSLKRTRLVIGLLVAIAMMFTIRSAVAEVFVVPVAALEPELPQGSRVLVYKLDRSYNPGQIIVYRHQSGQAYLGRVDRADRSTGEIFVTRNGSQLESVSPSTIIGRVVMNTR